MFCDKNVFFLLDVPVNDKRNGEIREGENKNCEGGFVFAFAIHIILHPQLRNYRDAFP